jgi:outer membrane protein, heavy metal efflux system
VKYETRLLYSQLQFQLALVSKLRAQDSLYRLLMESATRLYTAGQIDFLEKTYAESQYGEVHNKFIAAVTDAEITRAQLQNVSGIKQKLNPEPLQKAMNIPLQVSITRDTGLFAANPLVLYYRHQQLLSRKMISLERQRMLPGIVFGYLNQAAISTPMNLRFRAGITVPLWFWQYTANIKAARFRYMESTQLFAANQQRLNSQQLQAQGEYIKYIQSVSYYESTGMEQSSGIIESSQRLYAAGETDLVTHLRNMNDAYSIQINYLEALKNYNQSILFLNYTYGTL